MKILLALLLPLISAKPSKYGKDPGLPVVLIPGDGGSQLEANLTGKPSVVHYTCSKQTTDYFDLWLNLQSFAVLSIDCWADNMKLVFNTTTGLSSNMPGVDTRVVGFGDTEQVEWLDPSHASQGRYFFDIVDAMVSWGYRRGKDVVGAPFDWRKSPNELDDYLKSLKVLIEKTYAYNDNKKIVLVAHSMGNPLSLYFLNNYVDMDWKEKFINSIVSLAAPWAGSMQIVRLFASGYNMNYYRIIVPPSHLREMQRSFTSSAFLFPNPVAFPPTEILASTAEKNYTTANIQEFFTDVNYTIGWEQYKRSALLNGNLTAPGIKVHCAYGTGVDTPESFSWAKGYFPDYPPTEFQGDGDGTVNKKSARICERWKDNNSGKRVTVHEIYKADHMGILQHPNALELIRKAIYEII